MTRYFVRRLIGLFFVLIGMSLVTFTTSHLVPADDPGVTDEMWMEAARVHFRGPVIVGRDLLEV